MTRGTVQRDQVYVYGTCEQCQEANVLVYEREDKLLCAEHTRAHIHRNPALPYCDRCGKQDNVVRDPSHRRNEYLCFACHINDGFIIRDSVTGRAVRQVHTPYVRPNVQKVKCYADVPDCDDNVKPRGAWGGKMLCNKHGRTPPKK